MFCDLARANVLVQLAGRVLSYNLLCTCSRVLVLHALSSLMLCMGSYDLLCILSCMCARHALATRGRDLALHVCLTCARGSCHAWTLVHLALHVRSACALTYLAMQWLSCILPCMCARRVLSCRLLRMGSRVSCSACALD